MDPIITATTYDTEKELIISTKTVVQSIPVAQLQKKLSNLLIDQMTIQSQIASVQEQLDSYNIEAAKVVK
jgi:hypothetical protein